MSYQSIIINQRSISSVTISLVRTNGTGSFCSAQYPKIRSISSACGEPHTSSHPLCSAVLAASSPTVFSSYTVPAPASSHQPANSIFFSHHSSHQLQLQPSKHSDRRSDPLVQSAGTIHVKHGLAVMTLPAIQGIMVKVPRVKT